VAAALCTATVDTRETEMQSAELSVTESSPFELNICAEKLKRYKSQSVDYISELNREGGKNLRSQIHKHIKLHGLSPRANYTDRATAASRRSGCQLLRIKGATWSA
jgi:hypothetical protein